MRHAELRRAIFIDIESLRTRPPRVVIVGILTGGEGEQLEQLVVDPAFASACAAKRSILRAVSWNEAVHGIVGRAHREDRRIVGWSNFDRDGLIGACPQLEDSIRKRYVNALDVARPWRANVHPTFRIQRADGFSPRHTLDQYARLAGYNDEGAFENATPAKWIRHLLAQLQAREGEYRWVTREARRDWHKVLEYNRHDLLALRHITCQATRELELWRAYQSTSFCVGTGARPVCFRAGSRSSRLDALLARQGATRWAFITAWNPGSVPLSSVENARRHAELCAAVGAMGLATLEGEGIGRDPSWPPERSLLILGISRVRAVALGRHFGQLAIVAGRHGEPSRLLPTN